MESLLEILTSKQFISSAICVGICILLLWGTKKILIKNIAYRKNKNGKTNALAGVLFNVLQYIIVLITIVVIFKINGQDVTSIIAGLGIVATIVGLALQDTLKDVIMGVNIYSNNFYHVGDYVDYNGTKGKIKYFTARITKIETFAGDTITVCNREISSITKIKTRLNAINVNVPFRIKTEQIEPAFQRAVEKAKEELKNDSIGYILVSATSDRTYTCQVYFECTPPQAVPYTMTINYILYNEIEKENIDLTPGLKNE